MPAKSSTSLKKTAGNGARERFNLTEGSYPLNILVMRRRTTHGLDGLPKREAELIEATECALVSKLPEGADWIYEVQLDQVLAPSESNPAVKRSSILGTQRISINDTHTSRKPWPNFQPTRLSMVKLWRSTKLGDRIFTVCNISEPRPRAFTISCSMCLFGMGAT